jgi:uncharacterized protein (TIGR02145 family)
MIHLSSYAQDSITDFDGNVYHAIEIGTQVWLKENLKSLHYADGTEIPDVVAYNNTDSMANIYGRLYPWNAAMKNSVTPGSQGVCPAGWHIPAVNEWQTMDNFLGGSSIAGGKLKEAGYDHWLPPNTGATNSSGFTGLPAGEYDANQSQNFLFLGRAAVFWTSNQNGALMATEKYLSHDDEISGQLAWYKTMKYSIRCIKDVETGNHSNNFRDREQTIISNPFRDVLTISSGNAWLGKTVLYDLTGKKLIDQEMNGKSGKVMIDTSRLPEGMYILEIFTFNVNPVEINSSSMNRNVLKCYKITSQ